MSYIGSSATPLPVSYSGVRSQSFSGTGSQTAFTLSRAVTATTDIEVVVNNVQQNPFDSSFGVSGSTLTFSEAPSSGTNNIYVIFRDQPLGSIGTTPTAVSDQPNASTGAFDLPSGTTAQRPGSPSGGMTRVNSDTGFLEYYNGTSWLSVGSYPVEYIVVAGGGGGGAGYYAGGGGAGGIAYGTSNVAGGSQYGVTVGAGGASSQYINLQGTSGQNSVFQLTTAIGGGGGGSRTLSSGGTSNGLSGGSGGGASWPSSYGGSGTAGQGYAGGNTGSSYGSGGGGAGGVGGNAFDDAYLGSYGGPGVNTYSTWATATSTGVGGYFAGGGGAGTRSGAPTNHYYGGAGGGGNGGVQGGAAPVAGTTNTGGGGGGADTGDSSSPGSAHYCGANGGSGIVIIRYAGSQRGTGGTVVTTGGYTYHTFTGSGAFIA